jgi:ribosomal protein S12 methylthiotransferase accessory factor
VYAQLAPLLNGQYTADEIVTRLDGQVSAIESVYALELLHRRGYIADAAPSASLEQVAFWDLTNIDSRGATQRLQNTSVSVETFGEIDSALFRSLLTSLGLRVGDKGEFCIVLTDDYLHDGLDVFNERALARKCPWLLVKPVGTVLWIGPLFLPGKTGCWACLAHRLRGARKIDHYLREKTNTTNIPPVPAAALPSTVFTALSLAATETAKWVVLGQNESLEGQIVTLNVLSLDKQMHTLIRRPQCPHCGDPAAFTASQSAPLVLQSRKKSFTADGGHRSFAPEETFTVLAPHISPITGIVGALRPLSPWISKASPTLSFAATQNFIHAPREESLDLDSLNASLIVASGGKGKSLAQAKVSALCEAIERYSGTFQGDEFRLRARGKDLGGAAVYPNACMLYSTQQLARRTEWNTRGARSAWVPELFDVERELEWSPVWSLTRNEPRYVPTAYCYYGYSRQHQTWFARADSNGCAAGRNKEEAILQGFLELVERDAIALWWYNRLPKPAVDLRSFAEPYFQELLTFHASLHRDLWVLDITSDLGIPSFAAISRRNDAAVEDITLGFGAHFDPCLGILRALTEVNQWLPVVSSGSPGKSSAYLSQDADALRWWKTATLKNHSYLAPHERASFRVQADYTASWSDDLAIDVMTCMQIAEARGLETLVLDQTRPDTGLAVVKVIVPGLRHFWPRFGPGRLYDVPVQMGWREEPLTENQLNPQYLFF